MEGALARPNELRGRTTRIKVGCGWLYCTINICEEYKEVFLRLGKGGGCSDAWCGAVGRLITFALNGGTPIERIIHALRGMQCPSSQFHEGTRILSCPDAIAYSLQQELALECSNTSTEGTAQSPPPAD